MPRPCFRAPAALLSATTLALCLTACGERTGEHSRAPATADAALSGCRNADTSALRLAVLEYIGSASPLPQRYLSAFGTDSAVPEEGFKALQDKGPTYFYNDDPRNQAQVKDRLAAAGPYASMLVVYKGQAETDNGNTVAVTLGGHYVGGDHDGKVAPVRTITVRCDSTRWRLQP